MCLNQPMPFRPFSQYTFVRVVYLKACSVWVWNKKFVYEMMIPPKNVTFFKLLLIERGSNNASIAFFVTFFDFFKMGVNL